MKRFSAIFMGLSLVVGLLSGCGSTAEDTTAQTDSSTVVEETTTDTADAAETSTTEDQEPCTITYFTWSQSSDGAYPQNMIDAFEEKYPWITVDFEMGSQQTDEYVQSQKVKFLAEDGIDVTTVIPSSYEDYVEAGYLEDITGADYLSNYTDSLLSEVTLDGSVYAIPFAMDVVGVMYNKDLFDANGWEVPTNKEEWLALCDTIAASGVTPMINGAKDTWPLAHEVMPFLQGLYINNPDIFDEISAGTASYTDQVFVDCFNEIEDYFQSDAVSQDAMGLTYDQAAAYFASGKAAMMCHGEWAMDSITAAEPSFEIGVFPIPYNEAGEEQVGTAEVGQFQAITSFSENKEAAELLVEYMSSPEGAQYFADSMGNFTTVSGVETKGKEQWTDLLSLESVPFYYDQMYTGASSELFKQLQLMYIGDATAEEALSGIQDAQNKEE